MAEIKNNWQVIEDGLPAMKSESFNLSRTYYRYMSEEAFDYIMKGSFKFNNPANWWDPFESLMVKGDYSALGYEQPATYVACFSRLANSEAHWKMYKRTLRETCIRVEFDMKNFIGAFYWGKAFNSQPHLYIGDVSYLDGRSILTIGKTSKYHKQAVPFPFKEKDYVDLLLLKRKSFKWEEEARIVVLSDEPQMDALYLSFDPSMAKSFIKSIQIEPNKNDYSYKRLYKKYKEWWDSLDDPLFYSYPFYCTKSSLYDEREPIVFKK